MPEEFNITTIDNGAREVGNAPPRLTDRNRQIREALEQDDTIRVAIPRGQTPTSTQREVIGTYMRRWARERGWKIKARTVEDGAALIFWREPNVAQP